MNAPRQLLVLYTGGTLGMQMSADGLAPAGGFDARLRAEQAAHPERPAPPWVYRELSPPIDSANMTQGHWLAMREAIVAAVERDGCDAVLLLHGTDTLAYSAAALSFLLLDLGLPVVRRPAPCCRPARRAATPGTTCSAPSPRWPRASPPACTCTSTAACCTARAP